MMVMSKLLRRSKLRWLPLKLPWTRVFKRLIIELPR